MTEMMDELLSPFDGSISGPAFELQVTEEERAAVFEMLRSCGLLRFNMHPWAEPTLADWLGMTTPGDADVWLADGWGCYYLTQGMCMTPLAHFAIWPEARKDAENFLCAALEHCFTLYPIPAVMGVTPAKFRHVFPLLRRCGFEILGTIPGAVEMYGKPADGVVSVYRRR